MKNRQSEYDILRSISTILVVCYHFSISSRTFPFWPQHSSIGMGQLGVCLFFALSGTALCLSNPTDKRLPLKRFFCRRFSSLFPMYYLAWFIFTIYFFWMNRNINDGIPTQNILFTVFGMDGYLLYRYPTFYCVGEWFIGCIVLLYLCFPLLHAAIRKKPIISAVAILTIYFLTNRFYTLEMVKERFFLINLPIFTFGMYWSFYIQNAKSTVKTVFGSICSIFFVLALFVGAKLHIPNNLFILGITGYVAIYFLSLLLSKCSIFSKVGSVISKYSYSIFLVHHVVQKHLDWHFSGQIVDNREYLLIFIIYLLVTGVLSVALFKVYHYLTKHMRNLFQCKPAQ